MSLAPEGVPFLIGLTALAVIAFGLSLRLRSWTLWLVAFGLLVGALCVAWGFRNA
jgi:hypothetical protein